MTQLTPSQQALRHIELLGKDPSTSWFRSIKHGHGANSRRNGADLYGFSRDELRDDAIDGSALYLVVGDASTASGKAGGVTDADITSMPALFVEWDDLSTDEQLNAWQRLGLPQPTLMLTTGGKSVHAYWRLAEPIQSAEWKAVTARLIAHCNSDKACRNPSRVMRLAGSLYINKDTGSPTGARAEIAHQAPGAIYTLDQITACLPEPEPKQHQLSSPSPSPNDAGEAIAVEQFLPRDLLRTWEQGAPEGQRNQTAFTLACNLLAVHDAATASGISITGTPEQALLDFGRRCSPPIDDREITALFRSACSEPRTTDPGWPDRLRYHLNRKARDRRSRKRSTAIPQDQTAPLEQPEPADPDPIQPSAGGYFTCLGFDADGYYYQPHGTGQVVRLSRSSHTGTNLVALAQLGYWETAAPGGRGGPNWTLAASQLFEEQAKIGIYSPDRIRGRGAWWDQGRSVLHLGNRLVVDGKTRQITDRLPGSSYLYQRLAALDDLNNVAPLTDEEAFPLLDIASRFHWEVPASGMLLAGWVTLAPICGAIEWRPHAWLTAAAGSGKSAILDRFVGPLLGPVALWPEGNTTEAFIRQELRADALPVVFDEAESNEKRDQERIQSILSLARVASSSGRGVIGKGGADGSSQRYVIRSMFLMSSIATALKQGADRSRFAQLTLRNPSEMPKEQRKAHWDALDRDLDRFITDEIGRRLLARTTSLIPVIRESIKVFRRVAADHFDSQRLGDQYGTLLAGAWSLMSTDVVTDERARKMIADEDWEPYSQATEVPDERRCIQRILQHQVRVEADERVCNRSLGELVEITVQHRLDREVTVRQASEAMSRYGLKVDTEQKLLLVSNTAEALATILRDTAWAHSWSTVLSRLPGATKTGAVRFSGAGTVSRTVALQISDL